MARDADPAELVGRRPDERLLGEDLAQLPEYLGRPEALVQSPARARIVGIGATLTGVTLVAGLALLVLGAIELVSAGLGVAGIVALVAGLALVGTHWGWVHVAEASADAVDARRNRLVIDRRREWMAEIEPYTRWSVLTTPEADGSIAIVTARHVPVASGERGFTFVREIADREVHSEDEPAATVAERAELLRRRAAAATAQERARYTAAHDAFQRALMANADEQERVAAARAASQALSEQINSNLRDPPLME